MSCAGRCNERRRDAVGRSRRRRRRQGELWFAGRSCEFASLTQGRDLPPDLQGTGYGEQAALGWFQSFQDQVLRVADVVCGAEEIIGEYDDVVVVDHNIARNEHEDWFSNNPITHHSIGDCLAPRTAVEAIYEGHELARDI